MQPFRMTLRRDSQTISLSSNVAPVTVFEFAKCVGKLKHGQYTGLDGLTIEHVINCNPIIVQLMCMYNCILQLGYLTDASGTDVMPVVKNGDVALLTSIVALSPTLSKLFELYAFTIF